MHNTPSSVTSDKTYASSSSKLANILSNADKCVKHGTIDCSCFIFSKIQQRGEANPYIPFIGFKSGTELVKLKREAKSLLHRTAHEACRRDHAAAEVWWGRYCDLMEWFDGSLDKSDFETEIYYLAASIDNKKFGILIPKEVDVMMMHESVLLMLESFESFGLCK